MGQLEKYGLYVLVVVIVMILGVALMGDPGTGDPGGGDPAVVSSLSGPGSGGAARGDLSRTDIDRLPGGLFDLADGPLFVDIAATKRSKEAAPEIPPSRDLSGGEGEKPKERIADLQPTIEAPPAEPLPAATGPRQHVIVKGETASSIASKYYGTVHHARLILDANPDLDERLMRVGKSIVIPVLPQASAAAAPPAVANALPASTLPANARSHLVVAGDTLSSIAEVYYGHEKHWKSIRDANPRLDPQRMPVGTVVVVPPAPVATVAAAGARTAPAGAVLHRIAAGETLSEVSQQYYGTLHSWQRILDANPGLDAKRMPIGAEIVVPGVPSRRVY